TPLLTTFFSNEPATTELYPLSLHDALPISWETPGGEAMPVPGAMPAGKSNKFVYDTSPETGKPLTTHQWYDGTQHPWEFKRVWRSEEHTSELQSPYDLVCRLLLEKKKKKKK